MTKFTKGQKVRILSVEPDFLVGRLATVEGPCTNNSVWGWEVDVYVDGDEGLGKMGFYDDELELVQ